MADNITRKDFDELVVSVSTALNNCAVFLDTAREELIKASQIIVGMESFYCRKCKKVFKRKDLKISGLTVPCPDCGDGMIPARNLK